MEGKRASAVNTRERIIGPEAETDGTGLTAAEGARGGTAGIEEDAGQVFMPDEPAEVF